MIEGCGAIRLAAFLFADRRLGAWQAQDIEALDNASSKRKGWSIAKRCFSPRRFQRSADGVFAQTFGL
jgi:hypothetical protein